ncbi:hypothetical protein D9V32_05505 [Mycetocola tolaasinivorans]|uniref:Scaffolding protein n=1 Tax=Mycetocola tolaasinivorans TaxID=76635 RepID=A0A3L7A7I7_9MICO|nr:hypothetical protein [Mycetocola tolaasinivorans]RLP76326.1 hypothetical protein D9V32_05505 [Mycetocola tolaasinivorans]
MPEDTNTTDHEELGADTAAGANASDATEQDGAPATGAPIDEPDLGDAGKKALVAERAARRAAEKAAKTSAEALTALRAEIALNSKPESEQAEARIRAAAKAESDATANKRILRSELRAAAKGKLADPSDAGLFINVDDFEVGADGEVDAAELDAAITNLITAKPHLAAPPTRRFGGSGDQGAHRGHSVPPQLTRSDLSKMTHAEVLAADRNGQLDTLKGTK